LLDRNSAAELNVVAWRPTERSSDESELRMAASSSIIKTCFSYAGAVFEVSSIGE
jgi:hypothetical protein